MGRPKKNKVLHSEKEVDMTETATENEIEKVRTELDVVRLECEKAKKDLEELRANPKREYSEKENKIADKQLTTIVVNDGLKDKIEKQKAYDDVVITGRFMNRRHPGSSVKLTYMKYMTDPVKWYTFEDGKVYDIKRGFADQINEYYYKPGFSQSQQQLDPNRPQSIICDVDTSEKLYAFVPVGF